MWLRLALRYDLAYIAEPLACYCVHDQSLTAEFSLSENAIAKLCDTMQIKRKAVTAAKAHNIDLEELLPRFRRSIAELSYVTAIRLHRTGDHARSRRYAGRAIAFHPSIALKRPHVLAVLFFSSLLGHRVAARLYPLERSAIRMFTQLLTRLRA